MLSRSAALSLAFLAAHAAADANVAAGAGVYGNEANAEKLYARAVALDGNYILKSESTGRTLTYKHDEQPNIYPAADGVEEIMRTLSGVDNAVVSQTFGVESSSDGSIRIRFNDGDKCISAQWNFDWGIDTYGVAYECAVGSGAESDTGLRDAKQWFLAIPVEESSSSSSSSGGSSGSSSNSGGGKGSAVGSGSQGASAGGSSSSSGVSGSDSGSSSSSSGSSSGSGSGIPCEKTPSWVWSHPPATHQDFYDVHPECLGTAEAPECMHDYTWLHRHPDYLKSAPECQARFDGKEKRALGHGARPNHQRRRLEKQEEKRGSDEGRFYLVLTDHIKDMRTRAVTAKETTAFADAAAAWIGLFDENDEDQIWTITKA